jgi:GNAT superfamily N-acetyltransferase
MSESPFSPLGLLNRGHDRSVFDCGVTELNFYLRNYALQNQKRGMVRNYVTTHTGNSTIVAYYSLVYASLSQEMLPAKITKGLGKYDIPGMLLARLGVDRREQGKGLGKSLLKDAILRTIMAAEIAGLKLLVVHAKDETAAEFYRKHGFEQIVTDPLKLFLPVPISV